MTNTDLQLEVSRRLERNKSRDGLIFVIAMWLLSRSVIAIGMQVIAPLVYKNSPFYGDGPPLGLARGFLPKTGWELFSHWDGKWYSEIATAGYSYTDDGRWHSVAFYPLFPLLIRGAQSISLGLSIAAKPRCGYAIMGLFGVLLLYLSVRFAGFLWVA